MEELRYQIDLLNAMNQKLCTNEKMYQMICDMSDHAFIYYNFEEDTICTAANWNYFFDFDVCKPKDMARIFEVVDAGYIVPLKGVLYLEKRGVEKDSAVVKLADQKTWLECNTSILYDEYGKPTDKIVCFKNITKLKSQKEELTYMAYYDMLTGLYNRNYFVKVLGDFIRKAEELNDIIAVMFIDIDDFRKINDGLGLVIGDEVVQQFGQFLGKMGSDHVIVSHFNADIYCIAIYEPYGSRSIENIYKTIHERTQKPFYLSNGHEISISVSVGVAEYPEASRTTLELINCAEIVMFKAKSNKNGEIQYFDAPILKEFLQNVTIEHKLKEATFNQNFMLHFQPQYHIKDKKLRGVEALIRWKDDDGRMISPAVFIPIAESNGAIVAIGSWVIEESIKTYAAWRKKYHYPMILSLNISAIQYKRVDFISNILRILTKYEVNPKELELEITESVLIDDFKEIMEKLHILRDYGIRISLDDFGTGFSSLSYLKGLPIDTLKIDKSFIDTVINDQNTRIITESIVYMVKKLGFETVAEGVETEEQFEYLKSIECDCIQGYLLGKPMPSDEIEKVIKKEIKKEIS